MIGDERGYSFAMAVGWPWDLSGAEPTMQRCPVMTSFFIALDCLTHSTNRRWPPQLRPAGRRSIPDRQGC